jgi:hypothetical protein
VLHSQHLDSPTDTACQRNLREMTQMHRHNQLVLLSEKYFCKMRPRASVTFASSAQCDNFRCVVWRVYVQLHVCEAVPVHVLPYIRTAPLGSFPAITWAWLCGPEHTWSPPKSVELMSARGRDFHPHCRKSKCSLTTQLGAVNTRFTAAWNHGGWPGMRPVSWILNLQWMPVDHVFRME